MRARDLDRVNASGLLDAAYAEGQLGADEYHDRTAQVSAAKTVGELRALVEDLQLPAARVRAATEGVQASTRWRPLRGGGRYPGHTRATDEDRERTRAVLDTAHGEGQLGPEEHAERLELLTVARTLGDLADLVDDLQRDPGTAAPPRRPRSYRGRLRIALVTVAAVAVATGAFLLTSEQERPAPVAAPPATDLGAIEPVVVENPSPASAEGLAVFLRRYQQKFGDLQVDTVSLYEGHASLDRALPGQPNRQAHYDYWGGFEQTRDVTSRRVDTPVADLGVLNVTAVGAALAAAPELAKVPGGAVSHLSIEPLNTDSYARYGLPKGSVAVDIHVNNEFSESGRVLVDPTGRVANVWPFEG